MKRSSKALYVLTFAVCLTGSCKKEIAGVSMPQNYDSSSFSQVFEAFWTGMNNNYVFWSIDTTNWDRVYTTYKPKFEALDIHNAADINSSIEYFTEITRGLADNHYNLSFFEPAIASVNINPALGRKTHISPNLSFNYFSNIITKKYFDSGKYYIAADNFIDTVAGKSQQVFTGMVIGLIHQHILYLHLNNFNLRYAVKVAKFQDFINVWNTYLGGLQNPDLATRGLIIDMRSNSGGRLEDLNFMTGEYITNPLHWAFTREKNGNGRLDYTPWADAIVTPQSNSVKVTSPIVVLTDQRSKSMAEFTTMALKSLPNTHIIGDTTYGANGPLNDNVNLYGGGQFYFAHWGYVFTSSAMLKYRDGKIYEGKGYPPDEYVPYDADSVAAGSDPQLVAAIKFLNK